jgi:AraC-like DNA-binding protein
MPRFHITPFARASAILLASALAAEVAHAQANTDVIVMRRVIAKPNPAKPIDEPPGSWEPAGWRWTVPADTCNDSAELTQTHVCSSDGKEVDASRCREPVAIADVAARAGMSVTSFHRHFKAVTGHSPLAFQRHMRLMEAKKLLAAGGTNVARVAYEVGYQSPSQFSREYKGMFGSPPAIDLAR